MSAQSWAYRGGVWHLVDCDGQCGGVCQDRYYATLGGAPDVRITLPLDPPPYVPVPIAPDAARDARVAARRAADARKAGSALSHLLDCGGSRGPGGVREDHATEFVELLADAIASRLQHNRDYGATDGLPLAGVSEDHSPDACRVLDGKRCPRCHYGVPPCTCPRPYGRSEAPDPGCPQHMPVGLTEAADVQHWACGRAHDRSLPCPVRRESVTGA